MLRSELAKIDMNALQTLVAVADEGSLSAAARRLSVNQSSVSYTIQRLRGAFGDPLFLRQGAETVATERCLGLLQEVRVILEKLHTLSTTESFNTATAGGTVSVACNYPMRALLMTPLVRTCRHEVPGLRLVLHEAQLFGQQQLQDNISDIIVGPFPVFGEGFLKRRLFSDSYVCVVDPRNPLSQGAITLEDYCASKHIGITHNGRWEPNYLRLLRENDVDLDFSVVLPAHDVLADLIDGSNYVATVPVSLAALLPERLVRHPFPLPARLDVYMYWSKRTHDSPLHRLVRNHLVTLSGGFKVEAVQDRH